MKSKLTPWIVASTLFCQTSALIAEELVYEVPVNDPALAEFATEVILDAHLRQITKTHGRHPERNRTYIELEYTMPPTLVGEEGVEVEMTGPVPAYDGEGMQLSSKQGEATCTVGEQGVYACRMVYAKAHFPINVESAKSYIDKLEGLTPEQIIGKKAVVDAFNGEPIGVLHGIQLEMRRR